MSITNKFRIFSVALVGASLALSLGCTSKSTFQAGKGELKASAVASMVMSNGAVYTMDKNNTVASAIAVQGDKILFVGSDNDVKRFIGEGTEIVDLAGKMLVPGFVDSHAHPPSRELAASRNLMFGDVEPSLDAYREALKAYAKAHTDDPVLTGRGIQLNLFNKIGLDKRFIDEIINDKPVLLSDTSGHGLLVNTAALTMSNINRETQDPPGGKVYKDKQGNPTGYLSDARAVLHPDLVAPPEVSTEEFMDAWRTYEDVSVAKGITAVQNAALFSLPTSVVRPLMAENIKAGKAKMRVNFLTLVSPNGISLEGAIEELKDGQQYVSDWQAVGGVKTFLDGVPEGKSAYLLEPYAETAEAAPDYRGTSIWTGDKFKSMLTDLDAAGYQMQTHAMGDASARMFIDAVDYAYTNNNRRDARHVMIHANLISSSDIKRMGELDIYAAVSPIWTYGEPIFGAMELKMLGHERYDQEFHLKDMAQAGVHMTGSADQPVTPDDRPLFGIEAGVTRGSPYPDEQGDPKFIRGNDQAVSVMEMLKTYTINGAKQLLMDHLVGSLEPGKKADMVILENDITAIDPMDISETKIIKTIVNGKSVYSAD